MSIEMSDGERGLYGWESSICTIRGAWGLVEDSTALINRQALSTKDLDTFLTPLRNIYAYFEEESSQVLNFP